MHYYFISVPALCTVSLSQNDAEQHKISPPMLQCSDLKDVCHKLAWKKQSHCCGEGGTWSGLAPGAALSEVSSTQAPVVYAADRCGALHVIGATLIHSLGIMRWLTILTDASLEEAPKSQISLFHVHEKYISGHP